MNTATKSLDVVNQITSPTASRDDDTNLSPQPRYRVKAGETAAMPSGIFTEGQEFFWNSWPNRSLEPVNEAARRITKFWERFSSDSTVINHYTRPISNLAGGYFLPEPATIGRRETKPDAMLSPKLPDIPRPAQILPSMPRYTLNRQAFHGGDILEAGAEVVFTGWPNEPGLLTAADENAAAVVAYFETNHGHPDIAVSPFCAFRRQVILPVLPVIRRPEYVAARW